MSIEPRDLTVVDTLLTSTRSVRMGLDLSRPVDPALIEECLELAVHAPSADNQQNWRWIVVTDPERRSAIADLYRRSWWHHKAVAAGRVKRWNVAGLQQRRTLASVSWLAQHLQEVPVLVIPCLVGRPPDEAETWEDYTERAVEKGADYLRKLRDARANVVNSALFYGSIYPAVWSFQLALRSRNLGSVMTCMHLVFEARAREILGIPPFVTQTCLIPVAHLKSPVTRRAPRKSASGLTFWNSWNVTRGAEDALSTSTEGIS